MEAIVNTTRHSDVTDILAQTHADVTTEPIEMLENSLVRIRFTDNEDDIIPTQRVIMMSIEKDHSILHMSNFGNTESILSSLASKLGGHMVKTK